MKKISVIVPCFNVADIVDRCVESLVNQTLGQNALEVLLVDDCSTDGTYARLKYWEEEYPEMIRLLQTPANIRQGGARDFALSECIGEYVGYCDSDDWTEPCMYEHMYEAAQKYGCDIVTCRYSKDMEYKKPGQSDVIKGKNSRFIDIASDDIRSELISQNIIGFTVWNQLIRRSVLTENKVSVPEGKAYEDIYFVTQLYFYADSVYILDEKLYHYWLGNSSTVRSLDKPHHEDFFFMAELRYRFIEDHGGFDKYKDAFRFDILMTYYLAGLKLLALRYSFPPYERYRELVSNTREWTGDAYRNNPYIEGYTTEFQKVQLSLLGKDISEEEFKQLCDITQKYYMGGKK